MRGKQAAFTRRGQTIACYHELQLLTDYLIKLIASLCFLMKWVGVHT